MVDTVTTEEPEPAATLRRALQRLETAATEVKRLGAVTGPQWSRLSDAIIRARVALATTPAAKQEQA
jgi:hypothetical protein